ncbi:MAG: 1,4-dihydroxy-2-naphthoate octaprenyltransferase [Candidatus Amoebophilus sp. 36-38]|nr:MAG: 1,4-dihydroxy-2-naphthoate octaprenyltransferase [Candidatus Amoebophilus sp. 36-38]
MDNIKVWFRAMRLPTILLAVAGVMMGSVLAFWEGSYNLWISLWTVVTASLLQIVANLANDYGDFLHGAGVGDRVVAQGGNGLSLSQLKRLLWGVILCALVAGLILLHVAGLSSPIFFKFTLLGGISILAAITYTMGPKPYAYLGLGDVSVFLFFGLIAVGGTVYLHTRTWNNVYLLPAISCGCLSVAVLNLNNIRDIVIDAEVEKKTLVVRLGKRFAICYQWGLILTAIIAIVIFTLLYYRNLWQWLFVIGIPRLIQNVRMTMRLSGDQLNEVLQRLVLAYLCFVLLFGIGILLSVYY